ncbi:MAG: OmpH family outer membrane protein [Sulfitobacter sp.]
MLGRLGLLIGLILPLWGAGFAPQAAAQTIAGSIVQSPVLIVDSERLYLESDFGKRAAQQIEAAGTALTTENRKIEAELAAEEKVLTQKRASMEAAEFRVLADAFDQKVQETRRVQDAKNRALNQELDEDRVKFLNAVAPVLQSIMQEAGAAVVFDRRTVFLSSNAVDITSGAIERVNAILGDGSDGAGAGD